MTVCVDTNVVARLFRPATKLLPLQLALTRGELEWAVTTSILLEYEEVIAVLVDAFESRRVLNLIERVAEIHRTVRKVDPQFRFGVIVGDHDDDKFSDCAIVANADFVITHDRHFAPLANAGYRSQPITPEDFIARFLTPTAQL